MIFTELVLQNFGPYAGRQVINLRPEKDNNPCPIILLGGMNGGGKTTLMDAIRLALYGSRALKFLLGDKYVLLSSELTLFC